MKAYLERFRAWWSGLADRERRFLSVGAAAAAVLLLYAGVWDPLSRAKARREADLRDARALAIQLEALAAQAPRSTGAVTGLDQSLLNVVDQSRRSSAVTKPPSRIQPEGDNTVRLWLEDVPFEGLVRWLGDLQTRYGVRVDTAEIERESAPGLVNVRLTLMRG